MVIWDIRPSLRQGVTVLSFPIGSLTIGGLPRLVLVHGHTQLASRVVNNT